VRLAVYVDLHLAERDLGVDRLAAAHHVSVRHLYAVWARAGHDVPLGRWIVERRLQRARDLLADPASASLTVAQVARRCGFADVSHFVRRFRGCYGAPPGEWRRAREAGSGAGVEGR